MVALVRSFGKGGGVSVIGLASGWLGRVLGWLGRVREEMQLGVGELGFGLVVLVGWLVCFVSIGIV